MGAAPGGLLWVALLLASLRLLIRATEDAHGRGDPFGPLIMRLLRGCRRELDAYERSR